LLSKLNTTGKQKPLPDGLDALEQACGDAGISLMPLLEATCRWVDPETFRRLPIWYPECHRGAPMYDAKYERQYTNKRRGASEMSPKIEPNIQAGKAIRQAMGIPVSWRGHNWTVCHIWGFDDPAFQQSNMIVRDPRYYSCIGNMVLLPTPLKGLTDSVPEVKYMLRVCAFNLYGWVPMIPDAPGLAEQVDLVRSGKVLSDYPQSWPRSRGEKLPPGTMRYNAVIEAAIQKRKREIKSRLQSASYPLYPRDSVRRALEFWGIEL
jgi:hypothetical protein